MQSYNTHHILQDQRLDDDCSNSTTLTASSSRTSNDLSTFKKWTNIGTDLNPQWSKDSSMDQDHSIGSSKGTLQTVSVSTRTTYATHVAVVGGDVERDLDDVLEDILCATNTSTIAQQQQTYETKAMVDTFDPLTLQPANNITTVDTTSSDGSDEDAGGTAPYFYRDNDNEKEPPTNSQPLMLGPTGMFLSLDEILDPTLLDSSLEMEEDELEENHGYGTNSNIQQIIRKPLDGEGPFITHPNPIERMPSGTSSISFSLPSGHSMASSASSVGSILGESNSGSGSGYYPSSYSAFSYGSATGRSFLDSDLSSGSLSSLGGSFVTSLSGSLGDTIGVDGVRVPQVDVVDMGVGAIAILDDDLSVGPIFDLDYCGQDMGSIDHLSISNDEEEEESKSAYLPLKLVTPPHVKRQVDFTSLLRVKDIDDNQDQDGGEEEENAYLPSVLCTLPPIESIIPIPYPPSLCVNSKDEEQIDANAAKNYNNTEEHHNQDQSYTTDKDEDVVPFDELSPIPTTESPPPAPQNPPLLFRIRNQSPIPATIKKTEPIPAKIKSTKPTFILDDSLLSISSSSVSYSSNDSTSSSKHTQVLSNCSPPHPMSTCSSDHTHIFSNCSPPHPITLDDTAQAWTGLLQDDCVLSILDCPGRKTRMKREKRNNSNKLLGNEKKPKKTKLIKGRLRLRSGGKKVSKMMQSLRKAKDVEEDSDGVVIKEDEHKWGESVVTEAIGRMIRASRLDKDNREDENCTMGAQLNCSGDEYSSPLRRRGGEERTDDNDLISPLSSFESSASNGMENEGDHDSRIRRWERRAVRHLKIMEFEEALCLFQKILASYESHINQCKLVNRDVVEYDSHMGTTQHNIGIVYLLNKRYDLACESLQKATATRASCLGQVNKHYISSLTRTGLAYYAQDQFLQAKQSWQEALTLLRQLHTSSLSSPDIIAELSVVINNLACAEFEIGQVGGAARMFREALNVYCTSTDTSGGQSSSDVTWKTAILRSNVGYVWLRMKRADIAIDAFKAALVSQGITPNDHDHNLTIAIREHLILALLRKGKKHEAFNQFSEMLMMQIEIYGPNHPETQKTMTKIHLLKRGLKCSSNHLYSTAEKVKGCCSLINDDKNNERCHHQEERQLERFEKLLKVTNTRGKMKCSSNHLHCTAEKVQVCSSLVDDDNNDQRRHHQEERQLERFGKLLKAPNTWGRASLLKQTSFR